MGIRLVESIKISYGGGNPHWDLGLVDASVLFDGEFFAVSCDERCQPDGPLFSWADLGPEPLIPEYLAGWYGPGRIDEPSEGNAEGDGYIAGIAA